MGPIIKCPNLYKVLPVANILPFEQICVVTMVPGTLFTKFHFINLQMGPISKGVCYITPGWKILPVANILAYCAQLCCDYGPWALVHNISFSFYLTDGPKKLECYITLGCYSLASGKHSSWLSPVMLWLWPLGPCSQHFIFFVNLWMGPIMKWTTFY